MYSSMRPSNLSISIHALREEGDSRTLFPVRPFQISIHALREEGDKPFILSSV